MPRHGRLSAVLLLLSACAAVSARPAAHPSDDLEDTVMAEAALFAIASVEAVPRRPAAAPPELRKVSRPTRPADRYVNDSRRLCAPAAGIPSQGDVKCKEMVRPQARDSHAPQTDL